MFANSQMLGADPSFPDAVLDSKPAAAPAPAAVPAVGSPGNMSWMDAVLQSGPAHGSSWMDTVLQPGPHAPPPVMGGGVGGMLGALTSFLPQIAPAVAGGMAPGAPRPTR